MIVGIDFDNTLACYDGIFQAEAVARGLLAATAPRHKQGVRDLLRAMGREEDWTELQGYIYGPGLDKAAPYPGALECIAALRARGVAVFIVSHKTPTPYRGPRYDLHAAARAWLAARGFHAPGFLSENAVFFEHAKVDKLRRIAVLGCTHFVDDLPEFLTDREFPGATAPLLFCPPSPTAPDEASPSGPDAAKCRAGVPHFPSWPAVAAYLEQQLAAETGGGSAP